eukprot:3940708-Pyramimonas_sp.AAC.1
MRARRHTPQLGAVLRLAGAVHPRRHPAPQHAAVGGGVPRVLPRARRLPPARVRRALPRAGARLPKKKYVLLWGSI